MNDVTKRDNRVADRRGLTAKGLIIFVLYAFISLSVAGKIAEPIFFSACYSAHAYFSEGVRIISAGKHDAVLSNGVHLSKEERAAYRAIQGVTWFIMFILAAPLLQRFCFEPCPQPAPPTDGQNASYRYAAFDCNGKLHEGLVDAASPEQVQSLLQGARLLPCEVRLASVEEMQSQELTRFSQESHPPSQSDSGEPHSLWRPGAPDNYVLPTPSGICKTRLNGNRVKGTLNLAKKGAESCALFTCAEGGTELPLEIPFREITRVDVKRFPFATLRIETKSQGDFAFSGDVLKIGSVFQYVLSTEKEPGSM